MHLSSESNPQFPFSFVGRHHIQMATQFYNGKRLSFDGQICTVRYFGEVKGTKGEWLGVEWDDPTRGKHSGENAGIRYFECNIIIYLNN